MWLLLYIPIVFYNVDFMIKNYKQKKKKIKIKIKILSTIYHQIKIKIKKVWCLCKRTLIKITNKLEMHSPFLYIVVIRTVQPNLEPDQTEQPARTRIGNHLNRPLRWSVAGHHPQNTTSSSRLAGFLSQNLSNPTRA